MRTRVFRAAAVAGLVSASALAATPAAAPAGPWTKVPALPTACYSNQDQWWDQNNAAIDTVNQAHYAQNDINEAIRQKFNDAQAANPMAMAQALQQKMMADPQNAQKYMEQIMQQGQQLQTEVPAQGQRAQQFEAESKTVMKQYETALAHAMGPADARWTALKKKMGIAMDSPGPGEAGVPDWAWVEWGVILRERDQAYAANCAQWWSATGPIHGYMKRYKDYLVQERIPYEKKITEEPALEQYRTLGIPTTGWRTTTDFQAAADYMKMASTMFGERKGRPYCGADGRCE